MWKRGGKRKNADDDNAGVSKKPFTKADSDDDGDSIVVCEISKNRKVSVRNWNGKVVVDIREFYVKDGKELPGKKGISLPLDQWKILREHIEEIDQAVDD